MSDEQKFCKDCRHFSDALRVGNHVVFPDSCNQPPERELIHGRKTPANPTRMRSEDGACKPEALLWQERPTEPPKPTEPEPLSNRMIPLMPMEVITARWWEFWK
jgi:hypothetical protein